MTIEALLTEQNDLLRELLTRLPAIRVAKAETAAVVAVETAKITVAPVPTSETTSTAVTVTYDEAKAAVTSVVKAKGRDGGLAVLAKFNTQSLLEVPEAQWSAVIAACEEALAK